MTYRELGEKIGYSEGNLRRSVSKNEVCELFEPIIKNYKSEK